MELRGNLRRWMGGAALALAVGMLILGDTAFHLEGLSFVSYWLACFALTITAVVVALIDLRAVRLRTRQEHIDLLQETISDIEKDARRKPRRRSKKSGNQ